KRAVWLSQVGPAKCEVSSTLLSRNSGLSGGGGSWSNTSRPAPKILLSASTLVSATSSITGPLLRLTSTAVGLISASSFAPGSGGVDELSGARSDTQPELASSSRNSRKRTPSASSSCSGNRAIS